jgi:hypothetical protein
MQELDRFDGVVIVTTNLFENYDPALLRRIQRHIHFGCDRSVMSGRADCPQSAAAWNEVARSMDSQSSLLIGGAATSQARGSWGTENPTFPDPHQSAVAPTALKPTQSVPSAHWQGA